VRPRAHGACYAILPLNTVRIWPDGLRPTSTSNGCVPAAASVRLRLCVPAACIRLCQRGRCFRSGCHQLAGIGFERSVARLVLVASAANLKLEWLPSTSALSRLRMSVG
jgi:hypothetical protein